MRRPVDYYAALAACAVWTVLLGGASAALIAVVVRSHHG